MHFTEPVYRNPYWPTHPLLQVTQGCTHNKFITHHTVAANLTGPNILERKDAIVAALDHAIQHGDMNRPAWRRATKRTL